MPISYGDMQELNIPRPPKDDLEAEEQMEGEHFGDTRPKWVTTECCQCNELTSRPNTTTANRPGVKCGYCYHVVCGNCTMIQPRKRYHG